MIGVRVDTRPARAFINIWKRGFNKQMARSLGRSFKNVKSRLPRAFRSIGLKTRTGRLTDDIRTDWKIDKGHLYLYFIFNAPYARFIQLGTRKSRGRFVPNMPCAGGLGKRLVNPMVHVYKGRGKRFKKKEGARWEKTHGKFFAQEQEGREGDIPLTKKQVLDYVRMMMRKENLHITDVKFADYNWVLRWGAGGKYDPETGVLTIGETKMGSKRYSFKDMRHEIEHARDLSAPETRDYYLQLWRERQANLRSWWDFKEMKATLETRASHIAEFATGKWAFSRDIGWHPGNRKYDIRGVTIDELKKEAERAIRAVLRVSRYNRLRALGMISEDENLHSDFQSEDGLNMSGTE